LTFQRDTSRPTIPVGADRSICTLPDHRRVPLCGYKSRASAAPHGSSVGRPSATTVNLIVLPVVCSHLEGPLRRYTSSAAAQNSRGERPSCPFASRWSPHRETRAEGPRGNGLPATRQPRRLPHEAGSPGGRAIAFEAHLGCDSECGSPPGPWMALAVTPRQPSGPASASARLAWRASHRGSGQPWLAPQPRKRKRAGCPCFA
jgi:hypothetical protein